MPKISDDRLLKHAIGSAVLDRLSLAEAYGDVGDVAAEARASAARFESLANKKLANMIAADAETARLCFIYAQQYEESRVEARIPAGTRLQESPQRLAEAFREVRMRRWGKTKLEAMSEFSGSVKVTDLKLGKQAFSVGPMLE